MEETEEEEIYELTAQILVLGYNSENAEERARKQIVINDLLEKPVKSNWSHLKGDDDLIKKSLAREIRRREARK